MADDIKQTLGFDAAQAIETLNQLDAGFAKLQQNLQSSLSTFTSFNVGAGKTVAALIQIEKRANAAADALGRLNRTKSLPAVSGIESPPKASTELPVAAGLGDAVALRRALGLITSQANTAGAAVTNMGNQATNALNGARRSGSGFALSLETITRVIGTQIIVRALNSIRNAVESSFQGFIDFNRAIAEIGTISDEPVNKLAADVRSLSDAFNAPILDVAKAKYEILSNGFITASDSTKVLTAALKFAKVGISDVSQAADLISTSLNAYGKSADEAENISAKLFKTIELGRVIGSELATSFGRVAPIAHEIGASEDEILAAFSSITIGGVKAAEAATQIRASLTALLKPSDAMKDALHELGFETGEQIIRAKGYQGALQAVISSTDGSANSIAKLFPNVRALNGVLRTAGSESNIFTEHLKEIQKASSDLLNKKFEIRVSSDAEKVATDLNKLKNFFTADLGKELVSSVAGFSRFVGGADTAINAMRAMAPVIGFATAALVSYNVASLLVTGVNRALTASFNQTATAATVTAGAVNGIVAAFAAFQLGKFIGAQITDVFDKPFKEAQDRAEQLLQFERNQAEARANLDKIETDKKFQLLNDALAVVRKSYFAQTEAASESNKQLLEEDKATFDKIISSRERFALDLKRSAQQANNDIIESRKRVNDTVGKLEDQRFNFSITRNGDLAKSFRERQRAEQLASQAAASLSTASRPEDQELAQNAFNRAESFARQAISSAQTARNLGAQFQAERSLEAVLSTRIAAEQQFQKNRAADAKRIEDEAAAESKRATNLRELAKDFLANANLFDKAGNPLPADQIDKQLAVAKQKLDKFKQEAFGPGSKFKLEDLFSFDKLQQRLESFATKGEIDKLFASDSALDNLRKQVQGVLDQKAFLVKITPDASKLEGLDPHAQLLETERQLQATQQGQEQSNRNALQRLDLERQIAAQRKLAVDNFQKEKTTGEAFVQNLQRATREGLGAPLGPDNFGPLSEKLQQLRQQIQDALKLPNVDKSVIDSLANQLNKLREEAPNSLNIDITSAKREHDALVQIFQLRQQIKALGDTSPADAAAATQFLESAVPAAAAIKAGADAGDRLKTSTGSAATSAGQMRSAFNGAISATSQIASNMTRAATEAAQAAASSRQISSARGGGSTVTAALGGFIQHFSSGGFVQQLQALSSGGLAKGTDNIPALLSNKEFVVNAQSSQRFLPQLQAINAGIQPSFNTTNRGGDTFNVGDININADPNPKETARQVIDQIRREQRRGTGNRFR